MRKLLERLQTAYETWRRGERRVASHDVRGRVYRRKNESSGGGLMTKGEPEGSIAARVYRAATGKWENLGVVAKPKVGGEK